MLLLSHGLDFAWQRPLIAGQNRAIEFREPFQIRTLNKTIGSTFAGSVKVTSMSSDLASSLGLIAVLTTYYGRELWGVFAQLLTCCSAGICSGLDPSVSERNLPMRRPFTKGFFKDLIDPYFKCGRCLSMCSPDQYSLSVGCLFPSC